MGITTWTAAGILRGGKGGYPRPRDDRPLTRGDKWSLAMFVFAFLILPIIAAIVIAWVIITAPPQDNSCCAKWVGGHCAERAH